MFEHLRSDDYKTCGGASKEVPEKLVVAALVCEMLEVLGHSSLAKPNDIVTMLQFIREQLKRKIMLLDSAREQAGRLSKANHDLRIVQSKVVLENYRLMQEKDQLESQIRDLCERWNEAQPFMSKLNEGQFDHNRAQAIRVTALREAVVKVCNRCASGWKPTWAFVSGAWTYWHFNPPKSQVGGRCKAAELHFMLDAQPKTVEKQDGTCVSGVSGESRGD